MDFKDVDEKVKAAIEKLSEGGLTMDIVRDILKDFLIDLLKDKDKIITYTAGAGMLRLTLMFIENDADKNIALVSAAEHGSLDVVQEMVRIGTNPLINDDLALKSAAKNGHVLVVAFLLGDKVGERYTLALRLAAENGHIPLVDFLLKRDPKFNLAFQMAILRGHVDLIIHIVNNFDGIKEEDKLAGLRMAVSIGNLRIAKLLLQYEYIVRPGESVIQRVLERKDAPMLEFLLQRNLDPNYHMSKTENILDVATFYSTPEMVKMLIDYGAELKFIPTSTFKKLARSGKYDMIVALKDFGVKIEDYADAILLYAAQYMHLNIIRLITRYASSETQRRVLEWAIAERKTSIIKILIEEKVPLEYYADPLLDLYLSLEYEALQDFNILKYLIEAGANVKDRGYVLVNVAILNMIEMVPILLDRGVSLERYGLDALIKSINKGKYEMAVFLINLGIDINKYGEEILYHATKVGNSGIIEYLIEKGVKITDRVIDVAKSGYDKSYLEAMRNRKVR